MSQDRRHRITLYAQTDVGMVRAGNEDTFLVLNLDTSATWTPVTVEGDPPDHLSTFEQADSGTILAVSDGMGGALAGEVASRMAVEGVRDHMLFFKTNQTFSGFPFHERLRLAVEQANTHINNESMGNADYAGMGATFTAAGVHDSVLTLAQIGDSRCYLMRNGRIALVTHDQSLVWQLVEAGHITEEEAETHQYKNVILQALGAQPRVNVVVDRIPLNNGDTILLCSDGLSGRVRAEEMLEIVSSSDSLKTACERLIQLANDRGGEDNITVIVARFEGDGLPPPSELTSERIERDPNLPYDVEAEIISDQETTLSPEQLGEDEVQALGSPSGGAYGGAATNRLSSAPPAQTAFLDPSQVPTTAGAANELTPEVAEALAKIKDAPGTPVPTAVGIPALTPEMIAEHAKLMAEANRPKSAEPAPSVSPPAPAERKSGVRGSLVAVLLFVAVVGIGYVVYRQQVRAAAERESLVREAEALNRRAHDARERLGRVAPSIEGMPAGEQHEQALRLRESILRNLDEMAPLVEPGVAQADSITKAKGLCDRVETDVGQVEALVRTAVPPSDSPQTNS
jgi:protein phosphatase